MARPIKDGADYFPLDVNMDDKFKLMEAEYGLRGFAIAVKLYQKIYANGYCYELTPDVLLLFAKECGAGGRTVSEVLDCCIRRGIFDKGLYEKYQMLTSSGIQRRYLKIKERASLVLLENKYLLLSASELPKNVTITDINADINPQNEDNNPQRKGKKIKVKESGALPLVPAADAQSRFLDDDPEMILAQHLFLKMQGNNPHAKKPDFQKWARDFDLLMRVDKRDFALVKYLVDFSQWHEFWKRNILSPAKLREKFDQLFLECEAAKKKKDRTRT